MSIPKNPKSRATGKVPMNDPSHPDAGNTPSTPISRLRLSGTFGIVPSAVINDLLLSAQARLVYAVLATYADENRYCYPSVGAIADRLGIGKRQVQRHLRALEGHEHIITTPRRRHDGSLSGTNAYELLTSIMPAGGREPPAGAARSASEHGVGRRHGASSKGTQAAASDATLTIPMNKPTNRPPDTSEPTAPCSTTANSQHPDLSGGGSAHEKARRAMQGVRGFEFPRTAVKPRMPALDPFDLHWSKQFEKVRLKGNSADIKRVLDAWDVACKERDRQG